MRAIVQRVLSGKVVVDGKTVGETKTSRGLVVLVGIQREDTQKDVAYIIKKILTLKLFEDEQGRPWSKSAKDLELDILLVSQFTLYAEVSKGNKPDFHNALNPTEAKTFYANFVAEVRKAYKPEKVHNGEFGAMMQVHLVNDGPVTIPIDSRKFTYNNTSDSTTKGSPRPPKQAPSPSPQPTAAAASTAPLAEASEPSTTPDATAR